MATIAENLVALQEAKSNIKSAIESKGQDLTDVPFTQYADKINAISVGGGDGDDTLKGLIDGTLTDLVIPEGTTKIRAYAFYNYLSLRKIEIPDTVTDFGQRCCEGCVSLTSFKINANSKASGLATMAFSNCRSLVEVYDLRENTLTGAAAGLPSDVRILKAGEPSVIYGDEQGTQYFEYEDGKYKVLSYYGEDEQLIIPQTINNKPITGVRQYGFYNAKLKNITLPDGLTTIESRAFYYSKLLENVNIPNTVTTIGQYAFNYCEKLQNISIPEGISTIEQYTFSYCSALKNIVIPDSVTSIGNYAFQNCIGLTSVTIGSNLSSIGSNGFYWCPNILTYDFTKCTQIPTLGNANVFTSINSKCKIYVPDALYDEWKVATNWTSVASKIYKLSEMPAE